MNAGSCGVVRGNKRSGADLSIHVNTPHTVRQQVQVFSLSPRSLSVSFSLLCANIPLSILYHLLDCTSHKRHIDVPLSPRYLCLSSLALVSVLLRSSFGTRCYGPVGPASERRHVTFFPSMHGYTGSMSPTMNLWRQEEKNRQWKMV